MNFLFQNMRLKSDNIQIEFDKKITKIAKSLFNKKRRYLIRGTRHISGKTIIRWRS